MCSGGRRRQRRLGDDNVAFVGVCKNYVNIPVPTTAQRKGDTFSPMSHLRLAHRKSRPSPSRQMFLLEKIELKIFGGTDLVKIFCAPVLPCPFLCACLPLVLPADCVEHIVDNLTLAE